MKEERMVALERAGAMAEAARNAVAERDAAILAATEAGASLREVAAVTGISHMTVQSIVKRLKK